MATVVIESLPANSGVVHIGAASFVMPWLDFRATPSQIARLEVAAMLESANDQPLTVRQLLAEIEDEMAREHRRRGKIPEGRALRVGANQEIEDGPLALVPAQRLGLPVIRTDQGAVYAPDAYHYREPTRSPAMDKFDRVAPVRPEDVQLDPSRMTPQQAGLLAAAGACLAEAEDLKEKRTRRDANTGVIIWRGRMSNAELTLRRAAKDAYATLQAETIAVGERDSMRRRNAETTALAGAGEIELDARGQLTRRNGLDTLLAAKSIDAIEHAAGEKYAEVFDKAKPRMKIADWSGAGGGSADEEAERRNRLRLLKAQERLTTLNAIVQARTTSPRAITTLRLTAGEGRPVSHFSRGAGRALNVAALKEALNVLVNLWGLG